MRSSQATAALCEAQEQTQALRSELSERLAEVKAAGEEKAKVEGEMRLVLRAMEHQKLVAARNLHQLNHVFGIGATGVGSDSLSTDPMAGSFPPNPL